MDSQAEVIGTEEPIKKSPTCFEGPFGELLRATGPMARANLFRFSTKYQDDETDLVYYPPGRYYTPSAGRWINRDPIGEKGGLDLYGFVGNSPMNRCDPFGFADYSTQLFNIHEAPWKKNSWVPIKGEVVVSVDGTSAQIAFRIERPDTAPNKTKWRGYEVPWRPSHRGANGWAYPNLAAMFNARGSMRYGGADPNKTDPSWPSGVDNDFAGVTVQREGSQGAPLVSADWVNENGVISLDDLSHSARIERKFSVPLGNCAAPVGIWLAYCDVTDSRVPQVFDEMLDARWPLEFMGTDFAYIRITWTKGDDGGLKPIFQNLNVAPPPSPMQFHWGQWMLDGAVPRYD